MSERFIDISVSLRPGLPVWPGDPTVTLEPVARTANGDGVNVTGLGISTHAGTHVDAEWHLVDDGATLEKLTPDRLIGPCYVADLTGVGDHLTEDDFENTGIPADTTRLLLKTRNSRLWESSPSEFSTEYVGITAGGASWLVERGIDVIGIDYLSVEPYESDGVTHRIILGAGRIILETIDLTGVEPGAYQFYCLPLRIDGFDGAPCRAVLGTQ